MSNMLIRSLFHSTIISILITLGLFLLATVSLAQVRTSNNFQLESDSINFGGALATSSGYTLESTAGEVATGLSESPAYRLGAGYQQMLGSFLSMSVPTNVVMTPNISGITGGVSNGSTSVLILTDSGGGYQLTLAAANAPAMRKGSDVIADYAPTSAPNPDFNFVTGLSDAHFGFSPQGSDVVMRYRNNGSTACNIGTLSTAAVCWDGLTTTPRIIAQGTANQPNGVTTTLHFRVGVGGGVVVPAGEYIATTTLTALPL